MHVLLRPSSSSQTVPYFHFSEHEQELELEIRLVLYLEKGHRWQHQQLAGQLGRLLDERSHLGGSGSR